MKILRSICFGLLCLGVFSASSVAQQELRLRLRVPGFKPIEVGVDDFASDSRIFGPGDQELLTKIPQIIRDDLWYALFFVVIEPDTAYLRTFQKEKLEPADWFALGAKFYLSGKLNFKADRITCDFELRDVNTNHKIVSDDVSQARGQERRIAHKIADAIVKQFTGKDGIFSTQLAFVSAQSKNREIFVCDFDGANVRKVTDDRSINLSPSFSPDGTKLLYTSYKAGNPDLWLLDLRSARSKKISAKAGLNSAAVWSPDGRSIAATLSYQGNPELYLLDANGNIIRRLTQNEAIDSSPSFSPDASQVAFVSDRSGAPQIYLADVETGAVNRLTFAGSYNDSPAWSPDGTQVALVMRNDQGNFDVCTVDVTGQNYRQLTSNGSNENPHWSPDGLHLVFSSNRSGIFQIYTMDFDGNNQRMITSRNESNPTGGQNYNPTWGPYLK